MSPNGSGATPSENSSPGSCRVVGLEPTRGSSNASTPAGTSNGHAIVIGLNQIVRLPKRSEPLIERYWG